MKRKLLLSTSLLLTLGIASAFAQMQTSDFSQKNDISLGTTSSVDDLVSVDLDLDGKKDLAVVNGTNTVSVFHRHTVQKGTISSSDYDNPTTFTPTTDCTGITAGDLNADGKPDLIIKHWNLAKASIYINQSTAGNISFSAEQQFTLPAINTGNILINDLDGDGLVDMIAIPFFSSTGYSYRNTTTTGASTITFASPTNFTLLDQMPGQGVVSDLNNDGKLDLAINQYSNTINKTMFFRNTSTSGNISFVLDISVSTSGSFPSRLALGDMNNDGKPDAVSENHSSSTYALFQNNSTNGGTLSFANVGALTAPNTQQSWAPAIQDMNGDGYAEIVFGSSGSGNTTLSILTNKGLGGTLSASSFYPSTDVAITNQNGSDIFMEDIDTDGKTDIFIVTASGDHLSVIQNIYLKPAPTTASSNLTFSAVTDHALTLNLTKGNGDNRIIIAKAGSAPVAVPQNGIQYMSSTTFSYGDALAAGEYVVYNGNEATVNIAGLASNTSYYFTVYESNGVSGYVHYLTSSMLSGDTTTALTSGMEEVNVLPATIYPNPVKDLVVLDLPKMQQTAVITISDLSGKEVMKLDYTNGQSLDLSGLNNGMYLLCAKTKDQTLFTKLIKE